MLNIFQEAQAYSEENGLLFMETSAKTAMNVNELFLAIGELILLIWIHIYDFRFMIICIKENDQIRTWTSCSNKSSTLTIYCSPKT